MSFSLSGGVEVFGFISPSDPIDTYPVIDPLYGIDGFRNVDTLTDLNNIPTPRRRAGMVVGISGGTQYYKLNPGPWVGTISDWSIFNSGGGSFTGGTVTGNTIFTSGVTATTLNVNGVFITGNTYTTGGTYSNGIITFDYNTGGDYQVTGLYTGETSYVNSLTTGVGLSADTTTGNVTLINTAPDQVVTISGGTNLSIVGAYPNFGVEFTGSTSSFFTGGTVGGATNFTNGLSANTFSATTISGGTLYGDGSNLTGIPDYYLTGLTFDNGTYFLEAFVNDGNTYQANLSILGGDLRVTGGTYDPVTGIGTFTNNSGATFQVSGFLTGYTDHYVTGFTYQDNTFTISDNSGSTFNATINTVTGLTVNGNETINNGKLTVNQNNGVVGVDVVNSTEAMVQVQNSPTEFSIFGRFTGETYIYSSLLVPIVFYTNGNNKRMVIDSIGNVGVGTTNPLTKLHVSGNTLINGSLTATTISAATYQNLPTDITITGGTYSAGTATFTNNTGGTFSVTGFTTAPNLSKILFVDPSGNDSTGTKGNMNLPYLTLEAAKSASTSGDTIYVFPGTYTVTTTDTDGLAKDGIAYYFSPKTIINKATLGPIFYANGFVNGFNVYGYGNFNKTGLNGAIFSSNNISVYGSVLTASVNVVGAGYTTGIKTTTGGSGIGLVINVTAVGGGGTISTFTISNVGADYKVGDIIDVVQVGGSGGKIRIDSVVNNPNKDADVSFEANDLFASNAADPDPSPSTRTGVFYIVNTARCNIKFNNLYISTTRLGFSINTSNVNVNMNSIVSVGGSLFVGPNGSLGGIGSSTLSVFGNLISAVGVNAQAFAMSSGGVGFINVQTINTPNTGAYSFGGNAATATFNVQTMGRIFGQAASTIYLNGYTSTIDGVLNLYGGVVGRINGIGGGTIQTAYGGLWSGNEAPTTMTISGGLITLEMQNQDTTTGFAISGGIVTLNGNWTNDDMGASSDLTGGTLIINGDYEYGGPFYLASRVYGINVAGGTLIVNGTMRVNSPSTTATYSLDASPIQFSSGKVIINGGTLISNVPQATPVRTVSANNSVTSIGSGVAGAGYTTGTKSTSGGTGTGLTLSVTNANGITNTTIVNRGSGYTVGNVITVLGGSSLATFVVTAVLEFKVYSAGMNTNLVQNGGTLAGKKKKIRVNIVAVINTQIQLNDNLGSGNIIFTANATTFPSLSQLAQALVTSINANAIQITASQDTPGSDPYFYLESDSADLGFTSSGGANIGEVGLVPGMYPITPKVLGTIIEDVDVE